MSKKILVTYASRTGSTAGVAEKVAQDLAQAGFEVDLRKMQEVDGLAGYDGVVLGSAIQSQQWLPEAVSFVNSHQAELTKKLCAMFSLCMTLAMKDGKKYRSDILSWIAPVRRKVNPVSEGLFAGVLDLSKVPAKDRFKFRISVWTGVWKAGDNRNWDVIQKWIDGLPGMFES